MDLRRILRDSEKLGRSLSEAAAPLDDEGDGFELTKSARTFSSATRKVVDEKLTFSAALLRAGEVHEANRILAEVEHDVRNEEAALLERMNEVTAKRAVTRSQMTRMRLVRMLATAMVGAGLLGVSAMGMAVAGMFEKRDGGGRQHARRADSRLADARDAKRVKKVMVGGVELKMSKTDLATYRRLTSGNVDAEVLEEFLVGDLDLPPGVVDQTLATVLSLPEPLATTVEEAVDITSDATEEAAKLAEAIKVKAEKAKETAAPEPEKPAEEPQPAEPAAEETPADETPSPEPEDDPDDDGADGDDEGDGDGQKTGVPAPDLTD